MTFLLRMFPAVALFGLLLVVVVIGGSVLLETAYGLVEAV